MSQKQPKYWDKWEGKIIKTLISHEDEFVNFNILIAKTGFSPKGLKMALAGLHKDGIIKLEGKKYFLVDDELKKEYKKYLAMESSQEQKRNYQSETKEIREQKTESKEDLTNWIIQWMKIKNLNFPLETKHFFLEDEYLDDIARTLIGKSKNQILVTAPFIDKCHLTKSLENAVSRKIGVELVARRPKLNEKTKIECEEQLKKSGIQIHYDDEIHAKIITIDNKVAIVSSMNLYIGSAGGLTKEAGIVTFDQNVVESVSKYVRNLIDKTETTV